MNTFSKVIIGFQQELMGGLVSNELFGGAFSMMDTPRQKKTLTLKQRLWIWDNSRSQGLSRTCHICHKRITRFNDMELDHIRASSKGGKKLAMTHKDCNRMKSSGSLGEIQRRLGIKSKKTKVKKTTKRRRRHRSSGLFDFN